MMAGYLCTFLALLLSTATISLSGANIAQEISLKKLGIANNDMALKIFRQLTAQSSENIFFSPLSLSTALAMLQYGTRGDTAKELRRALGYDTAGLQDDLVHETFRQYLTESLQRQDPSAYVIRLANAILLDNRLNPVSSYKREIQDLYQALFQDVDFVCQAPLVVNEINSWVNNKTNGKIDKLLDELDPSTVLVLLNAVYFKGTWKYQFQPRKTRLWAFFNNGVQSGAKFVPMMRMTENFNYVRLPTLQALEMPYRGGNISMVIVQPTDPEGLKDLENNLTLEKMALVRKFMYETKVILTMPKFNMQYSKEMSRVFQSLGVESIFMPGGDFSGMTPSREVILTQVLHKAVIEVNEEGSEAAGATAISGSRMISEIFFVSHPFLFIIVDNRNNMILFLGRVTNL